MVLAKYRYAAETAIDGDDFLLMPGGTWTIDKDLDGSAGIVFHFQLRFEEGTGTLSVVLRQGIDPQQQVESAEVPAMSFELTAGISHSYATVPVLLPGVGPQLRLEVKNTSSLPASVSVRSRRIQGVEIG